MTNAQVQFEPSHYRNEQAFSKREIHQMLTLIHSAPPKENITLLENYPNPFNPVTSVRFSIADEEFVSIKVINAAGNEICTLFSETAKPHKVYEITFDGFRLPSSVYFCIMQTERTQKILRMVLLK